MDLLTKIKMYESSIFEEYSSKRKNLIDHIDSLGVLSKSQTVVFINDLKAIIDPIKTSISSIDHYFNNLDFKNTESTENLQDLNKLMLLYLFLETYSTDETEETSVPESSVSVSDSLEESESKSSRSVSVTFSNKNLLL